ncbi:MAG: hypothetical protein LQ352_003882 [Teloschistes flavicans]|nr:MAG: hypothetical protein LQ352_003882 [Teloschistes flavicans]
MTAEAPDPKTFGSWEDAFQYPIATVRGMERQLRNDLDSNREKLRLLVGDSYRDLLGTADTIVEMDEQMQKVERYLGDMGVRCNSRLLDRKAANIKAWDNARKSKDRERYAFASQLAVLRSCPEVISRLSKSGGSVLLAAKVLVISRLLHKKLSDRTNPPPYLEILRDRLATLRRKLLARIDRRFHTLESSESTLLEAMCAFSLATNSSPSDVLRHFHHVRQNAITEFGHRKDDESIFNSLRLIVQTLRDSQAIFPDRLARALEEVKNIPLLHALDPQSQQDLNLDVHQRWLGEDITNFVPYIRHDDLQKLEAIQAVKKWAKQAFSSFFRDLGTKLETLEDPSTLVHLRQEMLELWFSNQRHSSGVESFDILEGIRDSFINRLRKSVHQQTAQLSDVALIIDQLLTGWQVGLSDVCPPMWDDATSIMNTPSSGKALQEALSIRAYGKTEPVRAVSAAYDTWLGGIKALEDVIAELREKKWADELDNMDEDDDDILENKQALLSEDDPRLLQEALEKDLEENFVKIQGAMQRHAATSQVDDQDLPKASHQAVFLLRIWRHINDHLPPTYPSHNLGAQDFVPTLQQRISSHIIRSPLSRCDRYIIKTLQQTTMQVRSLWEGDPALPVLPSPYVFRFISDVVRAMAMMGVDVWTPSAKGLLKRRLREILAPILAKMPEARELANGHAADGGDGSNKVGVADNPSEADGNEAGKNPGETQGEEGAEDQQKVNGKTAPPGPSEEVARDMKIQRLFDIMYLQCALRLDLPSDPAEEDVRDGLVRLCLYVVGSLNLEREPRERLRRDAEAYWKRTELLFGLLK